MIDLAFKLSEKMLRAESAHGVKVIVKHTHQHEVEVLRRLHGNQSTKRSRIIPLLDVIDERLMVVPLRTPLSQFLDLGPSSDDVRVLAMQFLEGVAYLQRSSVAHLDLKPDNIVVRQEKKMDLAIIDFDIAVFADAEPTTSQSSGTPGWCAPEVSAGKPYDPLLADRWSCGRVLAFFTKHMKHMKPSPLLEKMRSLSQQLMDPNPSLRPPVPKLPFFYLQDPDPSLQPPVPDLPNLHPQEMRGTLIPSMRLILSASGELEMLRAHGLQQKRELDIDAKEKKVKREHKVVQPDSRLVSQRAV